MIDNGSYIGLPKVFWIRMLDFLNDEELRKIRLVTKAFNELVMASRNPPDEFDWDIEDLGETKEEELSPDFADILSEIIERDEDALPILVTKIKNFTTINSF